MPAFVYVIASSDGQGWRSYVGWSTDVLRRLAAHNGTRRGAKSTRGRQWQLVHVEAFATKPEAMRREWFLKRDRGARKRMLAALGPPPAADGREGADALEKPRGTASLSPVTAAEDAMKAKALIVAALALAACAAPGEDNARTQRVPPVLGQVEGTLGGQAAAWQTYDFSRGAFDASAHIEGRRLQIIAFPPGAPDGQDGLLLVRAPVLDLARDGVTLGAAFVGVVDGRIWDAPRLRDMSATVEVTSFSTEKPLGASGYGRMAGTITAQLCAETGGDCQALSLTFDTGLQITP